MMRRAGPFFGKVSVSSKSPIKMITSWPPSFFSKVSVSTFPQLQTMPFSSKSPQNDNQLKWSPVEMIASWNDNQLTTDQEKLVFFVEANCGAGAAQQASKLIKGFIGGWFHEKKFLSGSEWQKFFRLQKSNEVGNEVLFPLHPWQICQVRVGWSFAIITLSLSLKSSSHDHHHHHPDPLQVQQEAAGYGGRCRVHWRLCLWIRIQSRVVQCLS